MPGRALLAPNNHAVLFGDRRVELWWAAMTAVSIVNVVLWWRLQPEPRDWETVDPVTVPADYRYLQWQLAGIYVLVCAFRAVLPRTYASRTVLFDHWLSCVFLGRAVATIAEVAFAFQCSIALRVIFRALPEAYADTAAFGNFVAAAMPYTLSFAQVCCWYSTVTLNYLFQAFEDGTWGITFAATAVVLWNALPGLVAAIPAETDGSLLPALGLAANIGVITSTAFAIFIFAVDVPMYIRRWRRTDPALRLSIGDGIQDALKRRVPTSAFSAWRAEMPWLSGYFTFGVWLSIAMQLIL